MSILGCLYDFDQKAVVDAWLRVSHLDRVVSPCLIVPLILHIVRPPSSPTLCSCSAPNSLLSLDKFSYFCSTHVESSASHLSKCGNQGSRISKKGCSSLTVLFLKQSLSSSKFDPSVTPRFSFVSVKDLLFATQGSDILLSTLRRVSPPLPRDSHLPPAVKQENCPISLWSTFSSFFCPYLC